MRPEDFVELMKPKAGTSPFRLGTIPADYVSGRPRVQFDGESEASIRTFPYAASYTPTANHRVLVAMVGHSGVVICRVV